MTPAQIHRARSGYYGEVSFIDTQIGRLLNTFNRLDPPAAARTWFVFASDHGDMLGDHNLWRKTYAYEGSAHIPLIIVPPRQNPPPARPVADEVVELRDIMPTVLALAGVACPPTVDGCDLLPLMQAPADDWREYIHGEHCTCYHCDQEMQYVTDGRQKLIWLPRLNRLQFFDLEHDPGECKDLADDPAWRDRVQWWYERLTAELAARDCGWGREGRLHCPSPDPLVSPYRDQRWPGPRQ